MRSTHRAKCPAIAIACVATLAPIGCFTINEPDLAVPIDLGVLGSSSQFVVRGTAAVADNDGPCPIWVGENGATYHLFQAPHLDNETFDYITTAGTTSRLVLAIRNDIQLACQFGTIAEVQSILEVVE